MSTFLKIYLSFHEYVINILKLLCNTKETSISKVQIKYSKLPLFQIKFFSPRFPSFFDQTEIK